MTTEIVTGLNPEGKKLLRIEARNAEVPIEKKPEWIKTKLKTGPEYTRIRDMVKKEKVYTQFAKKQVVQTYLNVGKIAKQHF